MSIITYQINGLILDESAFRVSIGSTRLSGISVARTSVNLPNRHGALSSAYAPVFQERSVTISAAGWGEQGSNELVSRFLRICTQPSLTLTRTVDGVPQQARVELASLDADNNASDRVMPLTAVFALPDVWWRGTHAETRELAANTTATLFARAAKIPQGFWTRRAEDGTSLLANFITYRQPDGTSVLSVGGIPDGTFGDAPIVDAILRLPKGVTRAEITDQVSGTGVIWSGTANTGAYTYLDCTNLTAWQHSGETQWTANGTNVSSGVDYPAAGPLQIWPNAANNSYQLKTMLTGSTDSIQAYARRAWW